MQTTTTCLVFKKDAQEAVDTYVSLFAKVFGNSAIIATTYYGAQELRALASIPDLSPETMPGPAGSIKTIRFTLNGQQFVAVNGGGYFGKFSESISIYVNCDTQEQIDTLWQTLSKKGVEHPCGWLQDKFGVSWQIAPALIWQIEEGSDSARVQRVLEAIFKMKKIDIEAVLRA